MDTKKITRFEVIDHTSEKLGRILVKYDIKVDISIQDDGRTMKVFLTDISKMENTHTAVGMLISRLPNIDWNDPYYKDILNEAVRQERTDNRSILFRIQNRRKFRIN